MDVKCDTCGGVFGVPILPKDFDRWRNGEYIQVAAPYLTADERELLVSNTCGECFDRMFAPVDFDQVDPHCNGLCLTPGDVGVHGTGVDVAYPHPDCPEHGG